MCGVGAFSTIIGPRTGGLLDYRIQTFSAGQMQTFGFVLGALGLYTADALRQARRA